MAANLFNLNNIQPLELNTTGLDNTSTIVGQVFDTTTNTVGDAWFIISIWGLFFFFTWLMHKRDESFAYDISRTVLISSGFCFFISTAVLLSGWISTIFPLIWFSSITFIAFIAVYSLKNKGK